MAEFKTGEQSFDDKVASVVQIAKDAVARSPGVAVSLNSTHGDDVEAAAGEILKTQGISIATWGGLLYVSDSEEALTALTRLPDEEVEGAS